MSKKGRMVKDICIVAVMLVLCFVVCTALQYLFKDTALVPSVYILGAFVTSALTSGYVYGIVFSLISVLAVNYAFTYPFLAFDFTVQENIISAAIILFISGFTSSFTTRLKRHEILKAENERERMKANLLRAVSHDLRTPLTTIYGSSCAILENYDEFSDENIKKMLSVIKEDSLWLNRMVENLLSITKLENGNIELIKTETVLDELVDSILVKFAKRYPEVEVKVDIPDEFVVIPMDAILIEQVAINILENAVAHAEGMTELILKVFVIQNKAVFEILDNGCGIPKEKIKDIFTGRYSSDSVVYDGKKNNAGIGLSVCKSIIKAHGGDIRAENRKTGGAVFRFILATDEG